MFFLRNRSAALLRAQARTQTLVMPPQVSCDLLSRYLREPVATVRRLLGKNHRFLRRLEHNRHNRLSIRQLQRLRQSFRFPQQATYARLLATDPRSRILTSFHMGEYLFGMNALVASTAHPGLIRVLSYRAASAEHWRNMHLAFGDRVPGEEVELLTTGLDLNALSAFLRAGHNTLLLFCDVPPGNGELEQVQFLGRDAWFPRGAATLAVTNRVPLLPVLTFGHAGHNWIVVLPQIESTPLRRRNESYAACVQRITQTLVNILARYLQFCPEQWRYLQSLPQYFLAPELVKANRATSIGRHPKKQQQKDNQQSIREKTYDN